MQTGIKGSKSFIVEEPVTAAAMGSGGLAVLGTPSLVAWMEATAMQSVQEYLEPGQGTVGISIELQHTSPTPVGMTVSCESELLSVEGRILTFSVKACDEAGAIGAATHQRAVIDNDRFMKKAQSKLRAQDNP